MDLYIDNGLLLNCINKQNVCRGDLLELRNKDISFKQCAIILNRKFHIKSTAASLRQFCHQRFYKVGEKPRKKSIPELHKDIKAAVERGLTAEEIALELTRTKLHNYLDKVERIQSYINARKFKKIDENGDFVDIRTFAEKLVCGAWV